MPSGTLTPGSSVTAHITVKDAGDEAQTYQLDPRTTAETPYDGVSTGDASGTLPITLDDTIPQYFVPPFSGRWR